VGIAGIHRNVENQVAFLLGHLDKLLRSSTSAAVAAAPRTGPAVNTLCA
jgi:hypothetical protein